jgi:hypothetical protein
VSVRLSLVAGIRRDIDLQLCGFGHVELSGEGRADSNYFVDLPWAIGTAPLLPE